MHMGMGTIPLAKYLSSVVHGLCSTFFRGVRLKEAGIKTAPYWYLNLPMSVAFLCIVPSFDRIGESFQAFRPARGWLLIPCEYRCDESVWEPPSKSFLLLEVIKKRTDLREWVCILIFTKLMILTLQQ